MQITSVPYVDKENFADWFNLNQSYINFPHSVNVEYFNDAFRNLSSLVGNNAISFDAFLAVFLFIYNETGGTFKSMSEQGSLSYITGASATKIGYTWKERGRGLNQLTSANNYRQVLAPMGYSYDNLSAEQLDALFLQKKVYLKAFNTYLNDPMLAKSAWDKVQTSGDFYNFGRAISGGDAYARLIQSRANTLKKLLADKNITSESVSPNTKRLLTGASLLLFGGLVYSSGLSITN